MSDPTRIVAGIERAQDAFEYSGLGTPAFEEEIDQESEWTIQLTKACRYLESARALRDTDGFNGAVIELSFGVIERTVEAYMLWNTDDSLDEYRDHERVYDRAAERGLFERETAENLKSLYAANRTEHYYGGYVPTQQKEDATFDLAESIHEYTGRQIREHGVCICDYQ